MASIYLDLDRFPVCVGAEYIDLAPLRTLTRIVPLLSSVQSGVKYIDRVFLVRFAGPRT